MLVLDSKATGAFFCRRLCCGQRRLRCRRSGCCDTSLSFLETAEYHFYAALTCAATWDTALADQRQQHLEALAAHHSQLEIWAENCPENFENRAALVSAEIARIEGRESRCDAPVRTGHPLSARKRLCPQRGARLRTGCPLLRGARFRGDRASLPTGNARHGYLRWGADGKGAATRSALSAAQAGRARHRFRRARSQRRSNTWTSRP